MKKEDFSSNWKILKGNIKEKWGKLTDDEISQVEGKRDKLVGLLEKKYGYSKEQIEKELNAWEEECCKDKVKSGKF